MNGARYDRGIRHALRELNRIPGVRSRSSCQGRSRPDERSTHADFAYVLFRTPVPLAFEEHLIADLGELARVEPDSVYSRWPERNVELCDRLARSARGFREQPHRTADRDVRLPLAKLLAPLEEWLRNPEAPEVAWCFVCGAFRQPAEDAAHRPLSLLDEPPTRRAFATFDAFLAADPSPPDRKLREREGDRAVLTRLERGDFGTTYRNAWKRFVARAARKAVRSELRARVARRRAAGERVDFWLERGKAVFRRLPNRQESKPRMNADERG